MIRCQACGENAKYNEEFDAIACLKCNVWLEKKCCNEPNKECLFSCWKRPEKPGDIWK